MPYQPIGKFESQQGFARKTDVKRPITFFDRVRFVGPDSSMEIFGGVISGGNLGSLTIIGTLTMGTDGLFRTAASGQRIEFSSIAKNIVSFYTGDGAELSQGTLSESTAGSGNTRTLQFGLFSPLLDANDFQAHLVVRSGSPDNISHPAVIIAHTANGDQSGAQTEFNIQNDIQVAVSDGSASTPMYTFLSDRDTGMYRDGNNSIGWATNGVERMQLGGTHLNLAAAATGAAALYVAGAGTVSLPAFAFSGDTDTGMYRVGTNEIGFSTGGAVKVKVKGGTTNSGLYLLSTQTTGDTANLQRNGSTGQVRIETSARKYKSRINYNVDYLADIELKPAKFYRKDDKKWFVGFIADDLGDQEKLLGVYEDDEIENYDQRAVMAVMAAKINRLEARLDKLEQN